ncbi:hypothetical protein [Serinicoccus kebangsaanensis]|uniref:hypothetical protein n=1 Tax=Serinicoccus kebangsaanensis TaxID=2602069 RepID=UPI00124D4D7B|nr:hypothetical protein [Serinicoccus kebangsaanensis]
MRDPDTDVSSFTHRRGVHGRMDWWAKPVGMLLLAGLLLVLGYVLWTISSSDGYARELISAGVGAVITLITAALVAMIALRDRIRTLLDKQTLRRFAGETWDERAIHVGQMHIPQVCIVASCSQGEEWTERTTVSYVQTEAVAPDDLVRVAREARLPALLEQRETEGFVLTNGSQAALTRATLSLVGQGRNRRPHYTLGIGTSEYFDFATVNVQLDEPLPTPDGSSESLRRRWGRYPGSVLDVNGLPAAATIGSGTAVVTKDERLILGIRASTFVARSSPVAGRRGVHVVAEGLLPDDVDDTGAFCPRVGALRGVREELHIGPRADNIAAVTRLIETGFCFDQLRWQPYFTFVARIDRTWDEIHTAMSSARDAWEVETLISLPFDIEHAGVRRLLRGDHPDLALVSNHAGAALWFALLHKHGYSQMRDELS